jgi:hypothetical protein
VKTSMIGALVLLCGIATAESGPEDEINVPSEIRERKLLGTTIEWNESIGRAAAQARREGKLVLALHVSGHFDQPEFT